MDKFYRHKQSLDVERVGVTENYISRTRYDVSTEDYQHEKDVLEDAAIVRLRGTDEPLSVLVSKTLADAYSRMDATGAVIEEFRLVIKWRLPRTEDPK